MVGHMQRGWILGTVAALALAGCADPDLRDLGNGFDTSDAVRQQTAARPAADPRGIISYPGYQVAVARRGDNVASVAARVGLSAEELARYNGLTSGDTLRSGEVLALPSRVAEPPPGTAGSGLQTAPVDVSVIAGGAIDRAQAGAPPPVATPATPAGTEPLRHKVARGETIYSIARLYNVSVRSLADWNGIGPDLTVREGQYLLIPTTVAAAPTQAQTAPGIGSPTPEPPSSKEPLPAEQANPASPKDLPPSPDLATSKTATSKLQMPVQGKIIRAYVKKKNEGIDIGAAAGANVVAAADGTVAAITRDTDQVPIIVIRHAGNLLTVYAGLDAIKVQKGDKVRRGQSLGVVRAGNPSFVHFEVREGFESTDPVPYLN